MSQPEVTEAPTIGADDWYRDWRRIGPSVAAVAILLIAVAVMPSRASQQVATGPTGASPANDSAGSGGDAGVDPGSTGDAEASSGGGAAGGGSGGNAGDGAVAIPAVGPSAGSETGATARGVSARKVKVGFFYLPEGQACGQSLEAAIVAAGFSDTPRRSVKTLVEYFNEHGNSELFGLPKGSGYHGRKVEIVEYNDGGFFCPENGKAAAIQSTKDGIFAAVGGSNSDVQDPIWAANGIPKLEYEFFSDTHYNRYPGLIYSAVPGASVSRRLGAQYIAKHLWNKPAEHSPDPTLKPPVQPVRTFGWISADLPDYHVVHDRMQKQISEITGKPFDFAHEIFFQADLSTAAQQAAAGAQALKSAGVTTVVWFGYALAPLYATPAMTAASYFPEHLVVGHAGIDQDRFAQGYDQQQWTNAFGFSLNAPEASKDEWRSTQDFRKVDDSDVPDDADFWWKELYPLFLGLASAGPDLTVETWAAGLQGSCQPCPKFQSPGSEPTIRYGAGDFTGADDALMIRWNPRKQSRYGDEPPAGGYDYFNDVRLRDKVDDRPAIPWSKIKARRHTGF